MEALANQGDPFKAIPTPPPEIRICDLLFAWTERVWVYGVPGSSYIPLAAFIMNWLMTHGGFRCTLPCKLYVTVKVTPTGNTSQVGFPFGFLSGQEVIIKVSVICATIV